MSNCSNYEKIIFPKLHDVNIYSNIMYFIPSILAISYKYSKYNSEIIRERCDKKCISELHRFGLFGLIVSFVSTFHHTYNTSDLICKKYKKPTIFRKITGKLDVICAQLTVFYGLYLVLKRHKFNSLFFSSVLLIAFAAVLLFFYCLIIESKIAKIKDKNSQEYLILLSEYSFYHGYWHVLGGFCFTLIVYYLTN